MRMVRKRLYGCLVAVALLVGVSQSSHAVAQPPDACATASPVEGAIPTAQTAHVARITGPNAFATADGREIRLASVTTPDRFSPAASTAGKIATGFDPSAEPDDVDPVMAAAQKLKDLLVGQEVTFYPVTPLPDRYGRVRAAVARSTDGLWIEAELVRQGLARVEPQSDDYGCARPLEALEATARASGEGLWRLPEFAVIAADSDERIRWLGHYVLIEGTVQSIRSSGNRRYLNFGRNFSRDFAVVLVDKGVTPGTSKAKHKPSRFQAQGFDAADVAGKRIRVRGVLTGDGGGLMFPLVPEEIEWVKDQP